MILRQLDSAVTIPAKAGSIMSVEDLVALWASYVQRRTERAAWMMANNNWVVWLTEQGGEIFLGLAPTFSRVGRRRFCVLGEFQSDGPNGVGIWMDVDLVQEIEVPSNTVTDTWQVNPRSCLILWGYIAYIQRGEQLGKIGFTPTSSK